MLTAMTPEGYKINLETITIGDIGCTIRDSEEYIQAICAEFEWDAKVKEHFLLDQNEKSKKIHLLLGLKNCGHMMEPVKAIELNPSSTTARHWDMEVTPDHKDDANRKN